jgi:hypothetical protein
VTAPAAGAGGANTQIQFNNGGVLAGNSTYTMVSGVMKENGFNFVSQADVGSNPNQIPLNQYLGNMAFQNNAGVNITGGIVDVSAGTAALPSLGTTGDENTGIFFPAADTIALSTNGTERVRVTDAGDVGIGTSSPSCKFAVLFNSAAGNIAHFVGANNVNGFIGAHALNNGGLYINSNQANQDLRLRTQNLDRVTVDSSGNVLVGTTTAVSGGGILQVSNGITFPATQVPIANANTLDDYEEGTWTPTDQSGAGLSLTNTSGNCFYTKVGNLVNLVFRFTMPTTSSVATVLIGGFQFTPKSLTSGNFAGMFSFTNYGTAVTIATDGAGRFAIYDFSGTPVTNVLATGKDFRGVITYMT